MAAMYRAVGTPETQEGEKTRKVFLPGIRQFGIAKDLDRSSVVG